MSDSAKRGSVAAPLALVLAFIGLLLAGTVLLVVTVAPVAVAGLGLGHLLKDVLRGSLSLTGTEPTCSAC